MDEEELQKRFTDCVYFLASPLTCKKGIECEYRHSEIARLNPRDCWYWLGGCCFNPDCAFRHPPLEGFKEAYHEPSNLNIPPALPTDKSHKSNIPCYFYSKGFCNKGDKCSFLHGHADVIPPLKPSKPTSMVNNIPLLSEKKSSAESQTGSPPVKPHPNPSEPTQIDHTDTIRKHTEDESQQEISTEEESQESESESGDVSNSVDLPEEFVQSESDVFNDQSPDFDLVFEERLGSDQDVDFFSDHQHEETEGDPIEYHHHHHHHSAYNQLGNDFIKDVYDGLDKVEESRTSIFCRLSLKKKRPIFNGRKSHNNNDLREHLKRRKVLNDGLPLPYVISQGYDGNFRKRKAKAVTVKVNNRYKKPQQKRRFKEKSGGVFMGPKTLCEIKEEKMKNGFQGPRPLSEILKNKRKIG
ncbi:hypothetical protein LXL04_028033 [Taraxacum kok-saghyz]